MTSSLGAQTLDRLIADLRAVVGDTHVLVEPDTTVSYATDWTGRFVGSTRCVVRPASSAEVSAVLTLLCDAGVAVVPQGGNTGLVGGGVPLDGEVVLSLRRLASLGDVDSLAAQATFGAGVTLADAQAHAAAAGLAVGVDLTARGSATIGGMVATNAGGINVVRYGAMRAQVAGVEAVLADGTVLRHLAGLEKDNTGYDLAGLLTGSEGTLAVITAVRLRLHPMLRHRTTALLAVDDAHAAVSVAAQLRRLDDICAIEAIFGGAMELVCEHLGARPPVAATSPDGVWLLVECASPSHDPTEALGAALDDLALDDGAGRVAVATDSVAAQNLWRFRESLTEAVNAAGTPHKLDVTLPPGALARFSEQVCAVVEDVCAGARTFLFGHLGDGNVHVNVLAPALSSAPLPDAVDEAVLRLTAECGGSISAEHGIGTAKRAHLHLARSSEEIAAFCAIKSALDPRRTLNPNVLLPPA